MDKKSQYNASAEGYLQKDLPRTLKRNINTDESIERMYEKKEEERK